ncbi:cytochrome P450 [Pseudovirgaria hyperparasitica]|uniref:Cytochrome P450 n=1 Tax=Pseudovirgaria hyperparasitica TaxID=470096 RepID=A0A6A6W8S7_9PEZI|nr:cytochrome P450 [Pseudovirgaria hyperparasitica]KAF2759288.1 cytochrome P450 [Pseudovirgaria hyperparasitica]
MWDMKACFDSVLKAFDGLPVRLRLIFTDMFVVFGPENVNTVWKSPNLHHRAFRNASLNTMFKISQAQHDFYVSDDSGHSERPTPGSKRPPHLRVDYAGMNPVQKLLTGPASKLLEDRLNANLWEYYTQTSISTSEWTDLDDLWSFVRNACSTSILRAIYGERLLEVIPTFIEDFWTFDKTIHKLSQRTPRWLCPQAYKSRDKCIDAVIKWHADIEPTVRKATPGEVAWSPIYGTDAIRARLTAWAQMPVYVEDPGTSAADDLAFIWGANANLIPASFWMLVEVLHNPALLSDAQAAIARCTTTTTSTTPNTTTIPIDTTALSTNPLLQAIYAETMRLHVSTLLLRSPARVPLPLGPYSIPADTSILISSLHAHTDRRVWHSPAWPVDTFQPLRFLSPASASASASAHREHVPDTPIKTNTDNTQEQQQQQAQQLQDQQFSLAPYKNAWIPYGGGANICPGRHLAKKAMMGHLAVVLTLFEFDTGGDGGVPGDDMERFGLGTCAPDREVRVRVRRRKG